MKQIIGLTLLIVASYSNAESILLECGGNLFLLEPSKMTGFNVRSNPQRVGKLEVTDNYFTLLLEKSKTHRAVKVNVNRYSGEYSYEMGTEPFDEFKADNLYAAGVCTKKPAEKIF